MSELKPIEAGCLAAVISMKTNACGARKAGPADAVPVRGKYGMIVLVVGPSRYPCGCCWTAPRPLTW